MPFKWSPGDATMLPICRQTLVVRDQVKYLARVLPFPPSGCFSPAERVFSPIRRDAEQCVFMSLFPGVCRGAADGRGGRRRGVRPGGTAGLQVPPRPQVAAARWTRGRGVRVRWRLRVACCFEPCFALTQCEFVQLELTLHCRGGDARPRCLVTCSNRK